MYCNQTTAGRNRKLLDLVSTKGPNGYNELRTALKTDHPWLVELLDNTPRPLKVETKNEKEDKSNIMPDKSKFFVAASLAFVWFMLDDVIGFFLMH